MPLQGVLLIAIIPRAMPWARACWAFSPFQPYSSKDFFNYVFRAYEDYNKLINLAGNEDTEYCSLIRTLIECMPSTDWIPVILAYGRKFGDNGLLEFSQKVACKNIADAVCGKSPSYRIDHLNSIIHLIEESGKPSDVLDAQGYYSFNEHVFMANIQSEIYGRRYTYALLMLLEYKYKDKSEWKDFGTTSIEHILPQNPKTTSQWVKDFSEEQRSYYTLIPQLFSLILFIIS